jgi:hypothetical protein
MYASHDPGQFILDYVDQQQTAEKYGADPKTMKKKLRSELEKEITEKVTADLRKKHNIKTSMPTDVGGSRSASGAHQPYNRPSADEVWNKRRFGKQQRS